MDRVSRDARGFGMADAAQTAVSHTRTDPAIPDSGPPVTERIGVLDVLRGIALLGMFLVHFDNRVMEPVGGIGRWYGNLADLFFHDRFFPMFGILFGVGFAVQLRRAGQRGGHFVQPYLRRLLALAGFGFIAHGIFGYNVLLAYAIWGVPLLLVRNWSNRALTLLLIVCAVSGGMRVMAIATYHAAVGQPEQFRTFRSEEAARDRAAGAALRVAVEGTDFARLVVERIRFLPHWYSRPFSYLPFLTFTLFLIGLLGYRLGLFDQPERHRRLIVGCMMFGIASWAAATWLFPVTVAIPAALPMPLKVAATLATQFNLFNLVRDQWLAFTYIGAVLLLVAHDRAWLRRLSVFGVTGRMALTNYMFQVMLLDITFSRYGLGLQLKYLHGPVAALALFWCSFVFSRWWLSRYRYGPLEWLWRSATYARWQPLRRMKSVEAA